MNNRVEKNIELTSQDRDLIAKFIEKFEPTHTYKGLELRISSKDVRTFLDEQEVDMSFTRFNRITRYLKITSENKYAYSLPLLYTLKESRVEAEPCRTYPEDWIFTIDWHGSKRYFREEWSILLKYVSNVFNCNTLVDAFAGTGFISLLAAKLGLFETIIQNDLNTELFNYYRVMKDEVKFKKFAETLKELPEPSKEAFNLIQLYYKNATNRDRRVKQQLQTVDAGRAVMFFYKQHYSYSGVGGYSTVKKPLKHYIESLERTHNLYRNIELKHLQYNNCIRKHLEDTRSFIILDPPYCKLYRSQTSSYELEFNTVEQHEQMLNLIKDAKARIILCGYRTEERDLYKECLIKHSNSTWHCIEFKRESSKASNHEHIWTNFEVEGLLSKNSKYFNLVY